MGINKANGMREAFLIFSTVFTLLHLYVVVSFFQSLILDNDKHYVGIILLDVIVPVWYLLFQFYVLYLQFRLRGFYWLLAVEYFGCGLLVFHIFAFHGALYLAVSCAVLTMLLSVYFIFLNRRLFPFLHARTVD